MKKILQYTSRDGDALDFTVYPAEGTVPGEGAPCVVFFFGGGWMCGRPEQFEPQSLAFSRAGFTAITPFYRTARENARVQDSMADAFYFLRELGERAAGLHIDPDRIFLGGGSAGGHLALCSVLMNNLENNLHVRGLLLYNAVVDSSPGGYMSPASADQPFAPVMFSPLHHLLLRRLDPAPLPPVIMFYGTDDTTVPYARARMFYEEARGQGNAAAFYSYEGEKHGFFNFFPDRADNRCYEDTLQKSLAFCRKLI